MGTSFTPIIHLETDNRRNTNKRQKNMPPSPPSPPSTAIVVQQPQQPTLLQHPASTATINGSVAGRSYRLRSNALNAVTAETPPIDNPPQDPAQERIDNPPQEEQHPPQEEQHPPPEEQHPRSSLQLALLANDTSQEMAGCR